MTPDPAGKAATRVSDPQTWNMYAYALNNPGRYTDPLGLYETNCGNDEKCQKEAARFEESRQRNLKSHDANVRNAAAAYGDPGDPNGVTVSFVSGKEIGGDWGNTTGRLATDEKGNIRPVIQVKIQKGLDERQLDSASAHEGSHVADRFGFVRSIKEDFTFNRTLNLTQYETERKAYRNIEGAFARALGMISLGSTGSYILRGTDLPAQMDQTINQFLADPANRYNLTPQTPGLRLFPGLD